LVAHHELRDRGCYLFLTQSEPLAPWIARGYVRVPALFAEALVLRLLERGEPRAVRELWWRMAGRTPPRPQAQGCRDEIRRHLAGSRPALLVFERRTPLPVLPPSVPAPPFEPRDLDTVQHSLTLVLVDALGNPAPAGIRYVFEPDHSEGRAGAFSAAGQVIEDKLTPGAGTLTLEQVHPDAWFARGAPWLGYLRSGVSVSLLDAHGQPIPGVSFRAVFDNGTTIPGELDDAGHARIDPTPSYRLRVELPDYDPESWE
jgi:hypothetical protein